jgi:manganese-dependent ADP-ribose/CDP-alcohol diphosphatase
MSRPTASLPLSLPLHGRGVPQPPESPDGRSWRGRARPAALTLTILLSLLGAMTSLTPAALAEPVESATPLLRIGLVADAQYADKDTVGNRRYRQAGEKLRAAIADFAGQKLDFVVDLGDLIDGNGAKSMAEMQQMLALYATLKVPVYHIVGNHDLVIGRATLLRAFDLTTGSPVLTDAPHLASDGHGVPQPLAAGPDASDRPLTPASPNAGYYEWRAAGWRFIALDAMEISTLGPLGPEEKALAQEWLARHPDLQTYNGALTARQLAWLADRLEDAGRCGERVIVFSHLPTAIAASSRHIVPWNYEELEAVIATPGHVAAYIAGHHHPGGYAYYRGTHHLTMPGLVEAPEDSNTYAVLEVYPDRLVLKGVGTVADRVMPLAPAASEVASR